MSLSEVAAVGPGKSAELVALDEALQKLAEVDERKCRVAELWYFGGLAARGTPLLNFSSGRGDAASGGRPASCR
jgi:hypothetical protein